MARHSVLVEYAASSDSGFVSATGVLAGAAAMADTIPEIHPDPEFGVISLPEPGFTAEAAFDPFDIDGTFTSALSELTPTSALMRAEIEMDDAERIERENPNIHIFSDPEIEVCPICPGSPPMGNAAMVASLIGRTQLRQARMNGRGVLLAIVDTGINIPYLRGKGVVAPFDAARSWVPRAGLTPGALPVNHGTMCAYDATIAAPIATLLDIALLLSNRAGGSIMDGLLSDAVRAYRHLINVMAAPRRPGELRSMVVNNSWGMFHGSWDYPVGHPGNYSHNPNHPFNRIVRTLSLAGADICFASGNCGRDCPDGRCQGVTNAGIVGANGSPYVTSVAGVDVTKTRVGYSTSGPGAQARFKPDIAAYTHFVGSGVYAADGGTSAACPVAAGTIAAFRSRFHYNPANPRTSSANIRAIVTRTAEDRGALGFDFDYGFGLINGRRLASIMALTADAPFDISSIPQQEIDAFDHEMAANARTAAPQEEKCGTA